MMSFAGIAFYVAILELELLFQRKLRWKEKKLCLKSVL